MKTDELAQMYLHNFRDHVLTALCDTEKVQSYRCGRADSGTYCFYVTFTPAGICLQGDLTPEQNGSVSDRGYGRDWFTGKLGGGYLCEKFLQNKYDRQKAKEQLSDPKSHWREDRTPEQLVALDEVIWLMDDNGDDLHWLYDQLTDAGFDVGDGMPGWGYLTNEAAALIAIQAKFAELYNARDMSTGEGRR